MPGKRCLSPSATARCWSRSCDEEDRVMEEAAAFIPACVAAIDAYWREKRPRQISMPLSAGPPSQPVQTSSKIGRNNPCSCGSGKKFKKCCGKAA